LIVGEWKCFDPWHRGASSARGMALPMPPSTRHRRHPFRRGLIFLRCDPGNT
jgi:hypothetical protein